MGKFTEFEVTTSIQIEYEGDFADTVEGIAEQTFTGFKSRKSTSAHPVRMWEDGRNFRPKTKYIHCEPTERLKYYLYTRVAESLGTISLDFLALARQLDPKHRPEGTIGPEFLATTIQKTLCTSTGIPSLEGTSSDFNYLDVTKSVKYPGENVFVLRRIPDPDGEFNPLELVSRHVEERVLGTNNAIASLNRPDDEGIVTHGIAESVPFARTRVDDPVLLQQFRETFTDHFFDPVLQVRIGELDIHTSI